MVIDPSGRLPPESAILAEDGAARLAILAMGHTPVPACENIQLERTEAGLCPHAIVTSLFNRGFKRLLIEGGARTISKFIDAGAIDRLHLLVAPMIIGSGKTGLELEPIDKLDRALRPPSTVHVLADGDVLFDCDLAAARANLSSESS